MQPLHPLVRKLLDLEALKTWSVIVTLFGDFDGDHLTGTQIREILGHLGIKPEAIRVALHRLKADGWIIATKQGREAVYELSPRGRRETDAAARDVYRKDIKYPQGWQFYLLRDGTGHAGTIPVTKDLVIAPIEMFDALEESFALQPRPQELPSWIEERLVPNHLLHNAKSLVDILGIASGTDQQMQDIDARCMRLLALHQWRRLALRLGTWAHISLDRTGVLADCHVAMTEFLSSGKASISTSA